MRAPSPGEIQVMRDLGVYFNAFPQHQFAGSLGHPICTCGQCLKVPVACERVSPSLSLDPRGPGSGFNTTGQAVSAQLALSCFTLRSVEALKSFHTRHRRAPGSQAG